jgi:cysteine desulfurase
MIYLDYNATTPVDPRVIARMLPFFSDRFGNSASRDHRYGWDAADAVEEARASVAALINASPNDVMFTAGATLGVRRAMLELTRPDVCAVVSAAEHEAVLNACRRRVSQFGSTVTFVQPDSHGAVNLDELRQVLSATRPGLVAWSLANSELGTIQPIRCIAEIAHEVGALLFCDITHALGKISIDVGRDAIDMAVCSAHKIYGPKGVGALYARGRGLRNGEERSDGTANVPGIVGFGEACQLSTDTLHAEAARMATLRDRLEEALCSQLPGAWVNGAGVRRVPNTANIGFRGLDAKVLIRDMHDIAVSTRSACSSGESGPSHVLKALGLSDEQARSCIRFSVGRYTTAEEIDYTIGKVTASCRRLHAAKRL